MKQIDETGALSDENEAELKRQMQTFKTAFLAGAPADR